MLKVALVLFTPALLLASAGWPVQFTEMRASSGQRSFEASGAYGSVRIDHNGWFQGRRGFRFRNASSGAGFETPPSFTKASYFVGRDPKQWKSGIPVYDSLRERGVYPGIDAVYRSHNEHLEIDFRVKPGANPAEVALEWTGAGSPRLYGDGSLRVDTMRLHRPYAYQTIGGKKHRIACSYAVHGASVRFTLGPYDQSLELVIDPEVIFSQVLGRLIDAIAIDRAGNVYTAGSLPFEPTTPGAYAFPNGGSYVSKEDAHGRRLWTAKMNWAFVPQQGLAVDNAGNIYVAGTAYPAAFPLTSDALQSNLAALPNEWDLGFVSEISADGSKLVYSTFFDLPIQGNDGAASVTAVALSGAGQITMAGTLFHLPQNGVAAALSGNFVGRLSQDRTHFDYVTPLAGSVGSLLLDSGGNAIVGGSAFAADPGVPSLQPGTADIAFYFSKDGGATLTTVSDPHSPTTDLTLNPAHPDSMLRATRTGVLQSEDGGITWSQVAALGTDPFSSVWIDPNSPNLRFASTATKLYRSEDGGNTWTALSGASAPTNLQSFRADGSNIVAANFFVLYISLDGGKTWPALNPAAPHGEDLVTPLCCAIDPSNPSRYLVGSSGSGSLAGIFVTQDGGATFTELTRSPKVPLVFDPKMPNRVYGYDATLPGNPYEQAFEISEDAGATRRLPNSGVKTPVNSVAVDPSGSGILYGFGATGVYRSTDRGENWAHVPGELANGLFTGGAVVFGPPDRIYAFGQVYGDAYLAKVDSTGKILFSTLLGGRNQDAVDSLALLPNGDIIAAGWTGSDDMLESLAAARRASRGAQQGFLAKISGDGSALLGFRYVGGDDTDFIASVAVLGSGEIVTAGYSTSTREPDITSDAIVPELLGSENATVGVFSPDTLTTRYFSYLGGTRTISTGIAVNGMRAYVIGDSQLAGKRTPCGLNCGSFIEAIDLSPGASNPSRPRPRRSR